MVVSHKHPFPSSQDYQLLGLMTNDHTCPWADLYPRGQGWPTSQLTCSDSHQPDPLYLATQLGPTAAR